MRLPGEGWGQSLGTGKGWLRAGEAGAVRGCAAAASAAAPGAGLDPMAPGSPGWPCTAGSQRHPHGCLHPRVGGQKGPPRGR